MKTSKLSGDEKERNAIVGEESKRRTMMRTTRSERSVDESGKSVSVDEERKARTMKKMQSGEGADERNVQKRMMTTMSARSEGVEDGG